MEVIIPNERTAVFFDASNHFAAIKSLHLSFNYKKFREHLKKKSNVIRLYYYTALSPTNSGLKSLLDFLSYNGYEVIQKPTKEFEGRIKGNVDLELAVDCLDLSPYIDHYILATGDSDFIPLIKSLKRRGKKITIMSTRKGNPSILSDDLLRSADDFIEIKDLPTEITKDAST